MKTTAIARVLGWHAWRTINRRHDETLMRPAAVMELSELLFHERLELLRQMKVLEEAEAELDKLAAFNNN
jgi:hypothetical protein